MKKLIALVVAVVSMTLFAEGNEGARVYQALRIVSSTVEGMDVGTLYSRTGFLEWYETNKFPTFVFWKQPVCDQIVPAGDGVEGKFKLFCKSVDGCFIGEMRDGCVLFTNVLNKSLTIEFRLVYLTFEEWGKQLEARE